MPRVLLSLFVALPLTACVSAQSSAPSREEGQAAFRAFYSCAAAQAPAIDDGRSDASTVAIGVLAACRSEVEEVRRAHPLVDRDVIERTSMQSIVRVVLAFRAQRR